MSFMFEAGAIIVCGLICARVLPSSVRMQTPINALDSAGSEAIVFRAWLMSEACCPAAGMLSRIVATRAASLVIYVFISFFCGNRVAKIIKIVKFVGL